MDTVQWAALGRSQHSSLLPVRAQEAQRSTGNLPVVASMTGTGGLGQVWSPRNNAFDYLFRSFLLAHLSWGGCAPLSAAWFVYLPIQIFIHGPQTPVRTKWRKALNSPSNQIVCIPAPLHLTEKPSIGNTVRRSLLYLKNCLKQF